MGGEVRAAHGTPHVARAAAGHRATSIESQQLQSSSSRAVGPLTTAARTSLRHQHGQWCLQSCPSHTGQTCTAGRTCCWLPLLVSHPWPPSSCAPLHLKGRQGRPRQWLGQPEVQAMEAAVVRAPPEGGRQTPLAACSHNRSSTVVAQPHSAAQCGAPVPTSGTSSQLQALAVRSHTRMLPCWSPGQSAGQQASGGGSILSKQCAASRTGRRQHRCMPK